MKRLCSVLEIPLGECFNVVFINNTDLYMHSDEIHGRVHQGFVNINIIKQCHGDSWQTFNFNF
jgi:hypothetical protein